MFILTAHLLVTLAKLARPGGSGRYSMAEFWRLVFVRGSQLFDDDGLLL
jgi:hypothetical protein